jgi:hypothetical protein|tara:strand:- start:971 stop:1186 length:216 start_codon:yes stop_codon:yes gene_type:complete
MDESLESEYLQQLYKEGLSPTVTEYFKEMAKLNQRTMAYFMIMALEELQMYLDQQPHYTVDLEENETETQH